MARGVSFSPSSEKVLHTKPCSLRERMTVALQKERVAPEIARWDLFDGEGEGEGEEHGWT